jgi:hypothetical protein
MKTQISRPPDFVRLARWTATLLVLLLLDVPCAHGQTSERKVYESAGRAVVLLVDPLLLDGIRAGLDQFEADLFRDGYTVFETRSSFATPPALRAYLADLYARTQRQLVGVFLIGNWPRPYQYLTMTYANPALKPTSEEVISLQYYCDLDGIFEASPGYISPGRRPYSYDVHRGAVNWEIWAGVLPLYKGEVPRTIDAINRYFVKNHAYRTGLYALPRAFLQVTEHFKATTPAEHTQILQELRAGSYPWMPFSTGSDALLYFDSPPGGLTVDQGYAALSAGVADVAVLDAHGYWRAHGKIDVTWVEKNPVRTVFFWSNGCAVGNLDYPDNFLTAVLYDPASLVLAAKGTTNDSGGLGNNENGFFGRNIATMLAARASLGEALLAHVNVPLISPWKTDREFHDATPVVLGDPTLKLRLTPGVGSASLTVGLSRVAAGATLIAAWNGAVPSTDWIWLGLYPAGAPDEGCLAYRYTRGTTSGAQSFVLPAWLAPGFYELRLFHGATFARLATSSPFNVTKIEVSPLNATGGDSLTIQLSGIWPNACAPQAPQATLSGSQIRIATSDPSAGGICPQILTPWSLTLPIGRLPGGAYHVTLTYESQVIGESDFAVRVALATMDCAQLTVLKSADRPVTSSIEFVNGTSGLIRIYWISPQGQRQQRSILRAGESTVQATAATHVWVVTDSSDRCLGVYLPLVQPGRAVIM